MKFALINPNWTFEGSIYFGCREAHLPLEFAYSQQLLADAGHEAIIIDGQLDNLSLDQIQEQVAAFKPDYAVVTSAPSYLFWRCAPPELTCPQHVMDAVRPHAKNCVLVGPHASTTPQTAIDKTGADYVVLGECEEVLVQMVSQPLEELKSVGYYRGGEFVCGGIKHSANMQELPALKWTPEQLARHKHHHHRFDIEADGWGAEMETSRGCPYACSFCAKENFRNKYRKRKLGTVIEELDNLIAAGAKYVYFIDEIFLPNRELLEAIRERDIQFGVQTRIDLWDFEMLDLLGAAGCVSIEAGVESITEEGRSELNKNCKMTTDDMTERLIHARKSVAFVQGNLIQAGTDEADAVEAWRMRLQQANVWANKPVPLFPYPGSPDYTKRWGMPDYYAWERAHETYLKAFDEFSDVQDARPLELNKLEKPAPPRREKSQEPPTSSGGGHGAKPAAVPVRTSPSKPGMRLMMTCDAVGGVWTYAMDLCRSLAGHQTEILLAVLGPAMSEAQRAEAATLPNVRLTEHHGALEWMDNPWEDVAASGEWLLKQAESFRPDVVHLNGYAHARLDWKVPVAVVAHSCIYSWWNAVRKSMPPSQYEHYYRAVKAGLEAADVVIAPTRAVLEDLRRFYGVRGDLRVIYNGRNMPCTAPGPRSLQVFSAGRVWDEAKNFELLNSVAPEIGCPIIVAGGGARENDRRFSNLKLVGQLGHDDLCRYYTQSAVFVSAARYEPFGLCILEAALHGCPLVLPDLDSLREIWQDNALYVAPDSRRAFAKTIRRLLDDEVLRQRYSVRAFNQARHYTAERMAERYYRLYQELQPGSSRSADAAQANAAKTTASNRKIGNSRAHQPVGTASVSPPNHLAKGKNAPASPASYVTNRGA